MAPRQLKGAPTEVHQHKPAGAMSSGGGHILQLQAFCAVLPGTTCHGAPK